MAKKTLKKSKKMEATKPLMVEREVRPEALRPVYHRSGARRKARRGLRKESRMASGPLPRRQRPFSRLSWGERANAVGEAGGNVQFIEGDW